MRQQLLVGQPLELGVECGRQLGLHSSGATVVASHDAHGHDEHPGQPDFRWLWAHLRKCS